MCCSLAPARFTKTIIYAGEAHGLHVLAYQNHARSLATIAGAAPQVSTKLEGLESSFVEARASFGGNAMILHFPAVPGTMTPENVLDTSKCPRILDDMVRALDRPRVMYRGEMVIGATAGRKEVYVFEHDIYTILLAQDAHNIPKALDRVSLEKRPPVNDAIFYQYSEWFPGWPVAVCCFNNRELAKAKPLLWVYQPINKDWLFYPALDAHTGEPPNLGDWVEVDHWLIAGSDKMQKQAGSQVDYWDDGIPNKVKRLLPKRVVGSSFNSGLPNGDFIVPVQSVLTGGFEVKRVQPSELAKVYS